MNISTVSGDDQRESISAMRKNVADAYDILDSRGQMPNVCAISNLDKHPSSRFHFTEFGSMLDARLTTLLNAIRDGKKTLALEKAIELVEGARTGMKDYTDYTKSTDIQLRACLGHVPPKIDYLEGALIRAELAARESVQRTVQEIRRKDILKTKLMVYRGSGPKAPELSSCKPTSTFAQDHVGHRFERSAAPHQHASHERRSSSKFSHTFRAFEDNLRLMRDKFSAVEDIISLQKNEQERQIRFLQQENVDLKQRFEQHASRASPMSHQFSPAKREDASPPAMPTFERFSPATSPFARVNERVTENRTQLDLLIARVKAKITEVKQDRATANR